MLVCGMLCVLCCSPSSCSRYLFVFFCVCLEPPMFLGKNTDIHKSTTWFNYFFNPESMFDQRSARQCGNEPPPWFFHDVALMRHQSPSFGSQHLCSSANRSETHQRQAQAQRRTRADKAADKHGDAQRSTGTHKQHKPAHTSRHKARTHTDGHGKRGTTTKIRHKCKDSRWEEEGHIKMKKQNCENHNNMSRRKRSRKTAQGETVERNKTQTKTPLPHPKNQKNT